jgi:hypothetical protein
MDVLRDLPSQQSFLDVLALDKAIVYLLVDWSGPERASRQSIYKAFDELGKIEIPAFILDCSDPTNEYVTDWLMAQRDKRSDFNYGGLGETLLIAKGDIIDFIKYPVRLGLQKTKEKLREWSDKI